MFNPLDHPICLSIPARVCPSAWLSHTPFAMFLVAALRPRVLVELGTHNGCSYGAFCQAVKELDLGTNCFAVDTWEGDEHAGAYGPEILADLRAHHDPRYSGFSELLRMRFDDAVGYFGDGSIDLLHIDGFHSYEAVKHDFETWLPKLSPGAIVLFHDTNVRERDFGVWRFWDEVRASRPHFSFLHGYGLGVMAAGASPPERLRDLFEADEDGAARIRKFFYAAGDAVRQKFLMGEAQEANRAVTGRLDQVSYEADRLRVELENHRHLHAQCREDLTAHQADARAKAREIEALRARLDEANREVGFQRDLASERSRAAEQLAGMVLEAQREVADRDVLRADADRRHAEEVDDLRRSLDEIASSRAWALARRLSGLRVALGSIGSAPRAVPRPKGIARAKSARR